MTKVSLYDIEKMCVRAVNILGLDYPNENNYNKVFKIVLNITGTAKVGFGKEAITKEVVDERVEIRLFGLSNYKSVYWKLSENVYNLFYGRLKENRHMQDCMEYSSDFWFREAYHSSCWTEGFSFRNHFENVTNIKVIEMGFGSSSYVNKNEEDEDYYFNSYDNKVKSLLGELIEFENWSIDTTDEHLFWISFMVALATNNHAKGFQWSFSKSVGEGENYRYFERNAIIYYDYNNEPTLVHTRTNRHKSKATTIISPFNETYIKKYFLDDGFKLNFFSDFGFEKTLKDYLGSLVSQLTDSGFEVTIEKK